MENLLLTPGMLGIDSPTVGWLIQLAVAGILLALLLVAADAESVPSARTACLGREIVGHGTRCRAVGHVTAFAIGIFGYVALVAVLDRFWSATVIGALLIILLWAGNKLKVAILKEPLVFSDVFLAGHAFKYPRLYFGYAPKWIWPVLVVAVILLVGLVAREKPIGVSLPVRGLALFLLMGVVWAVHEWSRLPSRSLRCFLEKHPLTFLANRDAVRYTPLGAAFLHIVWHSRFRMEIRKSFLYEAANPSAVEPNAGRRHVMLVQAESFCCLGKKLNRPSVIPFINSIAKVGRGGSLSLDWRGAYTMRSEFAVLTGMSPEAVESYGFDPYRLAALIPMQSMARTMKKRGYRAIAWHPNDGRFFDRNLVMPNLGFDEFWDLKKLRAVYGERLSLMGRYVADSVLLALAAEYLAQCREPTFLFVITMEAHGPWHADNFSGADRISEEERYEAHLCSLDRGVRSVAHAINSGKLDGVMFLYGDHIPGLRALDDPACLADPTAANTEWILLGSELPNAAMPEVLRPEEVSEFLLRMSRD